VEKVMTTRIQLLERLQHEREKAEENRRLANLSRDPQVRSHARRWLLQNFKTIKAIRELLR
jgi:hypothetical protein